MIKQEHNEFYELNVVFPLVRTLEKAKSTGSFNLDADIKDSVFNETESDTSDIEGSLQQRRPKKMKVGSYH